MSHEQSFADLLRAFRVAAEMSQDEVAEHASLSAGAVGALERGVRLAPRRETVKALGAALRLNDTDLARLEASARRARSGSRFAAPARSIPTNLPRQLTPFVGRRTELVHLGRLHESNALVTVTGCGGIGKTRLTFEFGAEVAEAYPDGVWFVDIATLHKAEHLVAKLAAVLGVRYDREDVMQSALLAHLSTRKALLILDGCETLIEGTAHVASSILQASKRVRILATSRERLDITGEVVYRLPFFSIPSPRAGLNEAQRHDSVVFFLERADLALGESSLTEERLPIVIEICARLEGLALALELAAARLPALGLTELRNRLDDQLTLLRSNRRDAAARHKTLLASITWSYNLLDPHERLLLLRLSVFAGSCSLEAVRFVCADVDVSVSDCLASLVDKSMVETDEHGGAMRYRLLESIRTFVLTNFTDGEEKQAVSHRHALWIANLADRAHVSYSTLPYLIWYERYRHELNNARAAFDWALGQGDDPLLAARIISGLRGVWYAAGHVGELCERAHAVLNIIGDTNNLEIVASVYKAIAMTGTAGSETLVQRATDVLAKTGDLASLGNFYGQLASEL